MANPISEPLPHMTAAELRKYADFTGRLAEIADRAPNARLAERYRAAVAVAEWRLDGR